MSEEEPKRRGTYGDGHIRDRADGRKEKRLYLGKNARGKYIRASVYGRNRREVQAKARALLQQATLRTANQENLELGDYLLNWLDHKELEVAPRTISNYRADFERYIEPHLATLKLSPQHLTIGRLMQWRNALEADHGAYTANRARDLLRNALSDAVIQGLLPSNPALAVKPARHEPAEIEILSAEQVALFLEFSFRSRLAHMFHVALSTGLRHGEAAALQWSRVKLHKRPEPGEDAGEILVNQAVVRNSDGERVLSVPKRSSRRVIGLTQEAAEALRSQRELLNAEGLGKSQLVFPNATGGLQDESNTNRALQGIVDACNPELMTWIHERRRQHRQRGLAALPARRAAWQDAQRLPNFQELLQVPYVSFHDLRHTFASMMISAGMDAVRLSLILGHKDPAFTMRRYAHLFELRERPAMPSISALLRSEGN